MPTITQVGALLQVPYEDIVKVGEQQVKNPNSQIFKSIQDKLAQKLAAHKAAPTSDKKPKWRVYIQHAVSSPDRYTLISEFPQFNIKFSSMDMRAAAMAHAIYTLVVEELLSMVTVTRGKMLVYGISHKQIAMRNRSWMHLCVPGHDADIQAEFLRDDRALAAMVGQSIKQGSLPALAYSYMEGKADIHCAAPHLCNVEAKVAVMSLHRTDTNFRQLALYMQQHHIELCFFSIPGNKHMEMCTAGDFPELDAYVFPSATHKYIHIAYKNDSALDMAYLYSNYLELIARVQVVVGNRCYRKEFVGRRLGVLQYKITAFPAEHADKDTQLYRSWIDPQYKDKYMVYAPLLKPAGNVHNPDDYDLIATPMAKSVVDVVYDHAMRVQGVKDMAHEIERRLHTYTSNYALMNQILSSSSEVSISEFDMLSLVIYCVTYMQKFKDGTTVAALAPQARESAALAKVSMPMLTLLYAQTMLSKATAPVETLKSTVRNAYYKFRSMGDLPLPSFTIMPGFVEYSSSAGSNPRFNGWANMISDPTTGFTSALPGFDVSNIMKLFENEYNELPKLHVDSWALTTGDAFVDQDGAKYSLPSPGLLTMIVSAVSSAVSDVVALDSLVKPDTTDVSVSGSDISESSESAFSYALQAMMSPAPNVSVDTLHHKMHDVTSRNVMLQHTSVQQTYRPVADVSVQSQRPKPRSHTPQVDELVNRVLRDNDNMRPGTAMEYVYHTHVGDTTLPLPVAGAISSDPIADLKYALTQIFPDSAMMDTQYFESDKLYSDLDIIIKGIKTKIDISGLAPLKPERAYMPMVKSHVQPNVRNNLVNTLMAIEKRNANTPADADSMDIDMLFDRAIKASYKVYYVPGAESLIKSWPYIGPTEQQVREWVSKLDQTKVDKLITESEETGFGFLHLIPGMQSNNFMLKGRLKPKLDASYAHAISVAQSIQYDQSGKVVAVYTPMFSQKVAREQSILKPNIMVMQYKNRVDVDKFLCQFDWRPDAYGRVRRYLEADYTQFDKTQGLTVARMHYEKAKLFGMIFSYTEFYEILTKSRTVSSMKARVKQWLDYQNPSGFPNTLDRNNDTNMLVMAELLLEILDNIEFIMVLGDDITIAIRGDVDITHWESEINRKYNLNVKVALHDHGYICSMDIVHLPDGKSRVVSDVIKRALMLTQLSYGPDTPFEEVFESYKDITDGIQDAHVQRYLSLAIPDRVGKYLPTVNSDAVLLLCKVHSALRSDYKKFFRPFYSSVTVDYHY